MGEYSGSLFPDTKEFEDKFRLLYGEFCKNQHLEYLERKYRDAAMAEIYRFGFPVRHNEEWLKTPIRRILGYDYQIPKFLIDDTITENHLDMAEITGKEKLALVTIDGRAIEKFSSYFNLVSEESNKKITFSNPVDNAFTRLSRAFGNNYEIKLSDNNISQSPIHIIHYATPEVFSAPRLQITLGENVEATIVQTSLPYVREGSTENPSLEVSSGNITLGKGAKLNFIRLNADSSSAFNLNNTTVIQNEGSELELVHIVTGGCVVRCDLNVLSLASKTKSRFGAAVISGIEDTKQILDMHSYMEHTAPGSFSDQLYKMVIGGNSQGVFSGKIHVRSEAQQTNAVQLNSNLLMDKGTVNSQPLLEISADDVRCTHGSTTGRISQEELFYLLSRGIKYSEAIKILIGGFLGDIIQRVSEESLRFRILKLINEKLIKLIDKDTKTVSRL